MLPEFIGTCCFHANYDCRFIFSEALACSVPKSSFCDFCQKYRRKMLKVQFFYIKCVAALILTFF